MTARTAVIGFVLAFSFAGANAATFRVDDSLTLPTEIAMPMNWRSLAPSRDAGHAVEGASVLTIRLNLAPWLGKTGKVYIALPEQPVGQVTAEWTTQGRLLPGQLASGNRTLVFAGPIRAGLLEDTIVLKLQADGRRLAAPQRLQFYFEIDVD
jgi:hypothetical protein